MKTLFSCLILVVISNGTFAQESMDQISEKRVREMHRVICLSDKDQWRKFIKENYTEALINKPMRANVQGDNPGASQPEPTMSDNLEAKVKMFERLHNDFGASKIKSITGTPEGLTMILGNDDGMKGIFQFKFEKTKPYLINSLGIQAEN